MEYIPSTKSFDFSVIMAVYNVEPFLREAVDSLIAQDFGFQRIQLILIDDGSVDNSPAICDEYAARYPENILVFHKENGGVSSARNVGLENATGRILNFLDSDDAFTPNTFTKVFSFFVQHWTETDIVSVPLQFFDGATGSHVLNFKYNKGSRVIDLNKEPASTQMQIGSSFIRRDVVEELNLRFDPELKYAEDSKVIQRVLKKKMKLGVVHDAKYMYRRRTTGAPSAIQKSFTSKGWWIDYLQKFQLDTIRHYVDEEGKIPAFIQNTLCYDLQWRIMEPNFPHDLLSEEECSEYLALLHEILQYIDVSVIMAQKHIHIEHKVFLLRMKFGKYPIVGYYPVHRAVLYYDQMSAFYSLDKIALQIQLVELEKERCVIEGTLTWMEIGESVDGVVAIANRKMIQSSWLDETETKTALDIPIMHSRRYRIEIPLDSKTKEYQLQFMSAYSFGNVRVASIRLGQMMPISSEVKGSYFQNENWMMTSEENKIILKQVSRKEINAKERAYCKALWTANAAGMRKAVVARTVDSVLRKFKRKKIWIVSDRIDRAGDNGEAFFRYVMAQKLKDVECYYVLLADSPDFERLKGIGPVLEYGSKKHKIMHLLADCIISSSGDDFVNNPFGIMKKYYCDKLATKPYVFLQHGIIHDDLSGWINRFNKNLKGFVTSAVREYRSIIDTPSYLYTDQEVWLTGLPRYDRLYRNSAKKITIMPTWRRFLAAGQDMSTGRWQLVKNFTESEYYQFYSQLLRSQKLLDAADKMGYTIQFFPHPIFMPHVALFEADSRVKILTETTEYRTVYAESDLIVSDYSSAVFDFAYLHQPIIYAQFDAEQFFGGSHTCKIGYFDFERDGFGEVEHDLEAVIDRIIEYMQNDCQMKPMYRDRVDKFFAFCDQNNCERVYKKIVEMQGK